MDSTQSKPDDEFNSEPKTTLLRNSDNILNDMTELEEPITTNNEETVAAISPDLGFYNLIQAFEVIQKNSKEAEKLTVRIRTPMQMIDGSLIEFIREDNNEVLGSGRLRVRNKLHVNQTTGEMYLETMISDIVLATL